MAEFHPHPIIKQIIDRDCHVALCNREVIEHVISKLRDGMETYLGMDRADRQRFLRDCVQVHQENRQLYRDVMFPSYNKTDQDLH